MWHVPVFFHGLETLLEFDLGAVGFSIFRNGLNICVAITHVPENLCRVSSVNDVMFNAWQKCIVII